jgi:hypothetical protein
MAAVKDFLAKPGDDSDVVARKGGLAFFGAWPLSLYPLMDIITLTHTGIDRQEI